MTLHVSIYKFDSSTSVLLKLTAASYMPRNTAPPNEIAIVLGTQPLNNVLGPSSRNIVTNRDGKERTEGEATRG